MWIPLAVVLALALTGCRSDRRCSAIAQLAFERTPPQAYAERVEHAADLPLAIVGDLQRTSLEECLVGREVNDDATGRIVRDIASARPGLLVILGDMVFDGAASLHWQWFDHVMQPIRHAHIPVLPLLGNHEYYGPDRDARQQIAARFPRLAHTSYYASGYGRLGLVWLDSNAAALGQTVWLQQKNWLIATLAEFDANPAVRGVLVFLHHPPFTNSTVVDGDLAVRRDILPAFDASPKTLAMLSGHAHGYEHFVRAGKHFFVSAGGGGPRGSLHAARAGEPDDVFVAAAPRPFNYLIIQQDDTGIRVETRGFSAGESNTRVLETTSLPF